MNKLQEMNVNEFETIFKKTLEVDLKTLEENAQIVNDQLLEKDYEWGKCKLNETGLKELLLMRGLYALAIDWRKENANDKGKKRRKKTIEPSEWFMSLWKRTFGKTQVDNM